MAIDHPELDREFFDVTTGFVVEPGCPLKANFPTSL
jgi:hypothetical protein